MSILRKSLGAGTARLVVLAALGACYCPPPAAGPAGGPVAPGGPAALGGAAGIAAAQRSALAPLTDAEQAVCTEVGTRRVFKDTLGQDRYAVLSQEPVYRRDETGFPRTCHIEIFDYPKNLDLQATIELTTGRVISSRQLKDLQPAVGASEIVVARGIAESRAEERNRLQPVFLRPLEDVEMTAMVRTDGERCLYHRCVELDFYEKGPTAGTMQAAEPTNVQLTWRPSKQLARVVVDLTQPAVVSLEVF